MINASNYIKVRYSKIFNEKINEDKKIVILSDTHILNSTNSKEIELIISEISKIKPDYILMPGDIIDSPDVLKENKNLIISFITSISSIAKTYICYGNHEIANDYKYPNVDDFDHEFSNEFWNNINENKYIELLDDEKVENEDFIITGYTGNTSIYTSELFNENSKIFKNDFTKNIKEYDKKNNKPNLLLTHSPLSIEDNMDILNNYDFIITGHCHNGCVPFFLEGVFKNNSGLITPKLKPFPKLARGVKKLNNTYLLITGGWTKFGKSMSDVLPKLNSLYYREFDVLYITNNLKYKEKPNIKNKIKKIELVKKIY